jgi:hypothetical protein
MADGVEPVVYAVFHVCTGRPDWESWREEGGGRGSVLDRQQEVVQEEDVKTIFADPT